MKYKAEVLFERKAHNADLEHSLKVTMNARYETVV